MAGAEEDATGSGLGEDAAIEVGIDVAEPLPDVGPGDIDATVEPDVQPGADVDVRETSDADVSVDVADVSVDVADVPPWDATADVADTSPDADVAPPECLEHADCDDGVFCNGAEGCSEGRCYDSPRPPCRDGVDCTTDQCDEELDHCRFDLDDGSCAPDQVCDRKVGCFREGGCQADANCDDGLLCNGVERCVEGQCQPGEPLDCDDGVACTEDTCVEQLGRCQSVPIHRLCLPTELCNVDDGCIPRPPCERDDDCDDGWFCNGTELCDEEVDRCSAGELPEVPDEVPCTIDVCSEERDQVMHVPDSARCSDGQFCNGAELCHPADGCIAGEPPVLSDGVGCTVDGCDEAVDFIEHVPDDGPCDDGLFCNGVEVCHPIDGCSPGEPVVTNDGIGCTVDSCSEVDDEVRHVATDELCDDDLFCNGAERCDAEQGCVAGEAPPVPDEHACTVDRCDEAADEIVHEPVDAECDDELFCNGAERCDATLGCLDGQAPPLDDAFGCTVGSCDEEEDRVVQEAVHRDCDDGLFCNGEERCDVGRGCLPGEAPVVPDGIDCTADRCDEDEDRVVHEPQDQVCDDGRFCNGAEHCNSYLGCQGGEPPDLEDDHDCTDDRCDEELDQVVHDPVAARCDDGRFCNGEEACDPAVGCVDGADPVLDDLVGCTRDRCDEDEDEVVHEPDDTLCEQTPPCTAGERCDPADGCVVTPAPAEGEVCLEAPRSICLEGDCEESVCGDGFEDVGAGEECDDGGRQPGDGCDADCQDEHAGGEWVGTWEPADDMFYSCAMGLLRIDVDEFRFSVPGDVLRVEAHPGREMFLEVPGPIVMEQRPLPAGPDFSASLTLFGACNETFTLEGALDGPDTWTGEFVIAFQGPQCGGLDCFGDRFEVAASRVVE